MRKFHTSLIVMSIALSGSGFGAENTSPEALRQAGHWKRLRQMVEPQVANPKDAAAAYYLSCARMAFGNLDGALEMAQRAVALEPGNSQYHLQLGLVLGSKASKASFLQAMRLAGQYKTEVKKATELDPKNIDAVWELMEFYWHAPGIAGGDQKKARSLADDIMRLNPARGYLALTELADKEADVDDYLRKAAQADPKSYEVQIWMARLYTSAKHKNDALAEQHAQQAIALDPSRTGGYKVVAALRARQERWPELETILGESVARNPDDLSAYFQAGMEILQAGKDPARAEQYLRKYQTQE